MEVLNMPTDAAAHDVQTEGASVPSGGPSGDGTRICELLDRWVAEQIITPEQATLMGETVGLHADAQPGRSHRGSLVEEALGYLGGAIVVASSMIIGARYWNEVGTAWRLALLGCAALGLVTAGARLPARMADAGDRLRSVLWLASTAVFAGFLTVLSVDGLGLAGRDVVLLVGAGTAACALMLWINSPTVAQQIAVMVALAVTASSVIAHADVPDTVPGLGVWGVGVVWALLGWARLLRPSWVALGLGTATAILGAMTTAGSDAGMVLTLATVVAVVAAAVATRNLLLLGVGTVGLLGNLPAAATKWFPDSLAAPIALLVLGAALVLVAVRTTRRRPAGGGTRVPRDHSTGRAGTAVIAAGAVIGCVALVVTAIALLQ
jgi:hypothetical protein